MDGIDEIKVHVVVALCEELCSLVPSDERYTLLADKLEHRWRVLSPAEQDAVDQILSRRDLPAARQLCRVNGS
jgi:hypothetical protein